MGITGAVYFLNIYHIFLSLKLIIYFMYFAFCKGICLTVLVFFFKLFGILVFYVSVYFQFFLERCVIVTVWANPLVAMLV